MSGCLLSFQDLSFAYINGTKVFDSLTLDIPQGSITAILGPNGAGKTTLLQTALGRLRPQAGSVYVQGQPIERYSRREAGQLMSLVPQTERVPFEYDVRSYVMFGRTPYLDPLAMPCQADWDIANGALAQVGIEHLADRSINRLSGGERQLTLLARALAQQPKILLMDEPTSHLDLANKLQLMQIMTGLVRQGLTILLTTHEPDVAARIATHLVLLRGGKLLFAGEMSEGFTAENLSACYGIPISTAMLADRTMVVWG